MKKKPVAKRPSAQVPKRPGPLVPAIGIIAVPGTPAIGRSEPGPPFDVGAPVTSGPRDFVSRPAEDRFLLRMRGRPDLIQRSRYSGPRTRIRLECAACGNHWGATPEKIALGRGCPRCGELRKLATRSRHRKNRVLKTRAGVVYVDVSTKKFPNSTMLVDQADWAGCLHKLNHRARAGRHSCYVSSMAPGKASAKKLVHQWIYPESGCTDHKNGNGLDNRRSNLRPCTVAENNRHRSRLGRNNTSGELGVSWHRGAKKWEAYISKDGVRTHLGIFKSLRSAKKAREAAVLAHFGDFRSVIANKRTAR